MSIIFGQRISPTLDLNFAQNKSLVDSMSGSNLIDFSRVQSGTSRSTYFGADGIIKYADSNEPRFDHDPVTGESLGLLVEESRTNYQKYSNTFNSYAELSLSGGDPKWQNFVEVNVWYNSSLDPFGTITATRIIPTTNSTSHYIGRYQAYTTATGYAHSLFLKPAGYSKLEIRVHLSTFTVDLSGSGSFVNTNSTTYATKIQPLVNGWYRLEWYWFSGGPPGGGGANTFQPVITILDNSGNSTFAGDGVSGIDLFGYQQEVGSFSTSYIPTPATFTSRSTTATYYDTNGVLQTAASGVARDNAYFPDENGVMRSAGLLLEELGTNLCTQSETFTGSPFTLEGATAVKNEVDPRGGNNATRITLSSGNAAHRLREQISNNRVVRSFFVKKVNRRYIYILDNNGGYYGPSYKIDLDLGTITLIRNSNNNVNPNYGFGIQEFPNGYYRVWFDAIQVNMWAIYPSDINYAVGASIPVIFNANGTEAFIIYGYQVESGITYPTSYIPTAGSTFTRAADVSSSVSVTRPADVMSITGTNFSSWYNNTEGTFFTDMALGFTKNAGNPFTFGGVFYTAVVGSIRTLANVSIMGGLSSSQTVPSKTALALKSQDFKIYTNGTQTGFNTSLSYTPTGTQLLINSSLGSKGHIGRITYYPERLSDKYLQKLTR